MTKAAICDGEGTLPPAGQWRHRRRLLDGEATVKRFRRRHGRV
ncbi:hypothetical protein [Streptomyces sp. HUCO-GS316]|nr:hypothetical protein [Streptomyces sp. HUCO-GS316]